ncbi:ras family domain-containing protein [Ditylenchus destructor]|uniref:Ras family domain-containing protein n=1 Tax=Ditylenchus destructor TaxID=166010 RepID=A0AAD4R7E6_9BILA|nr:ras family domain-containing protein [Ditylenchus destructor]
MVASKSTVLPGLSGSPKTFKLVFLGEESVGKTSIISRFIHGDFHAVYEPTIGIDIHNKTMSLDGNKTAHLQLWDTAGQERFRSLIPSYIRDCSVGVVVYDISCRDTFVKICNWIRDVRSQRGPYTVMVLVGNKTDLFAQRQVSTQEGISMAAKYGMLFIETSAKSADNIRQLFHKIANVLPGSDAEDEPKRNVSIAYSRVAKRSFRENGNDTKRTSICQNFDPFCMISSCMASFHRWH